MSINVIMPQMGESIVEGTITKWLKKVGERIERDEPLFEISTDKVDSEIPAPASGVLSEILFQEGATVQVNTVVAVIREEAAAPAPAVESPAEAAAPEAVAAVEPAPSAPTPAPVEAAPAAVEPVAAPEEVAPVAEAAPPPAASAAEIAPAEEKKAEPAAAGEVRTSPLVRRLAREHGIDLSKVRGTGLGGRVTKQDIEKYLGRALEPSPPVMPPRPAAAEVPPAAAPPRAAAPAAAPPARPAKVAPAAAAAPAAEAAPAAVAPAAPRFAGESETVPMTVMRKSIAEHMVASKRTSAHVHTVFHVDVTSIVRLREKHKEAFEAREGIKLTFTPFFVKALVDTVRDFPILNCSVAGDSIVYKKRINVGVAVALEDGLIVPVVKDAHLRSFTGLALAIHDLAARARSKKLRPEDVQDGTISITNPGVYGSVFATPIIHQPQVAILGVGGIEKRPVVIGDAIAIRSMVYLTLSFDHRVVDGAVADQFMAALKKRLESWSEWIE